MSGSICVTDGRSVGALDHHDRTHVALGSPALGLQHAPLRAFFALVTEANPGRAVAATSMTEKPLRVCRESSKTFSVRACVNVWWER